MPLPFDFQAKRHLQPPHLGFAPSDLVFPAPELVQWSSSKAAEEAATRRYDAREPTSVLDARRSPSPPNSSSTLGSSGSGGAAAQLSVAPCGGGANPEFDQSMFGFILNDGGGNNVNHHHIDDLSGMSKLISTGSVMSATDLDSLEAIYQSGEEFGAFSGNWVESGLGSGHGSLFGPFGGALAASINVENLLYQPQQHHSIESLISHHQLLNSPSFNLPSGFSDQGIINPPSAKRVNTGAGYNLDHQLQNQSLKTQFLVQNQLQRQASMMTVSVANKMLLQGGSRIEEVGMIQQQSILEQVFKSAEAVSMGNLVLVQGILARLNHQLSPVGKAFERVAYYFQESLELLLHMSSNGMNVSGSSSVATSTDLSSFSPPLSLILKLGAFKSFSEISPVVQFADFTCNQAVLEAVEMHDRIHVIDFDIGYGGQWASLMQELALRNGTSGSVSLKITAFASYDDLELGFTRENLSHFASELNIDLDIKILRLDSLSSVSHYVCSGEAVVVHLPIGVFSNCALSLPSVLRIIKQWYPKIVVTSDRGWDRYDLPYSHHMIQALQSYSSLLESLDAANMNSDALHKIERFMIHPEIEKLVLQRVHVQDKSMPWRSVFLSSGFSPLHFSNFAESQSECLVQRTPVRGFQVEKKQSSLVLCWQHKELISSTAWSC